jgi:hypothetical protein
MKRSIITELYYRENSSHAITNFLNHSYPVAKLLICCMPSVCNIPPLQSILDRSTYDRVTEFFIRAILPPSLVFFLLFLSSSVTPTCCCSYPKFKTHVQTQPNSLYLLLPFHPILKPQLNLGQDAGSITARDQRRWHAERNERSLAGS